MIVLSYFPSQGKADTVTLGYISFDQLIPGFPGDPGVNGFTVANLTGDPAIGGNDLPPDFPVASSVMFLDSMLEWFSGSSSQAVSLGDLGPGFYNPIALQFPDTASFSSALFSATLDSTVFQLDPSLGGGVFAGISDQVSVELQPSIGNTLVAGTDSALITASNQSSSVPEPNDLFPVGAFLLLIEVLRRSFRRRTQNGPG